MGKGAPRTSKGWTRHQRGITGLETAIVLIAFVVVSSVFAFAALSTGLFASDRAKDTITAGLSEARGTFELKGSLIAQASTTGDSGVVSSITFQVANSAGGEAVDLTPGTTIINYQDKNQSRTFIDTGDYVFTVTGLGGADADNLVEQGELYEVKVTNMGNLTGDLSTKTNFTLQVLSNKGAVLHLDRNTPIWLESFNDLG